MTLLLPNENFSVGTSSSSSNKMDMSLDSIINSRRQETKAAASQKKRKPLKSTPNPRRPTLQREARAAGTQRAKRTAVVNQKRGLRTSRKPTPQEITKEVKIETNKRKVKTQPVIPNKKAISAAVRAMNEKGFEVPDGMKVVISFEPASHPAQNKNKSKGGTGQNNGNQGKGKGSNVANKNNRGGNKGRGGKRSNK